MDNSPKKTSAFGLSGEKISRLLSIGREDDLSGVVREDEYVADLRIAGYEIVEKIAEAGQGHVWRAIQLSTGRQVAIKAPRVGSVNSEGAMLRFEREIELVARLEHPHIARIYDSGVDRGQYYYVMDFVSGLNLDEYVRQNKLTHRQILELVRTICRAVQHAHQNRVIHRDLKPSNIIVTGDGHPYVVDFGLAKAILEGEQGPTISMDGETIGTPAYMSPEQAAGRVDEVDTRTDIYSLGVILFNLLTGESPHDLSGSRQQVLRRIVDGQVKRPRIVCRSIDRDLEALLLKTIDRDPDRRYSTASGLADDIGNYLDGAPLMAALPSTLYRLKKFVRRNVALSLAVLAAVVTLIVGLIATTAMYIQADHARTEAQAVSEFLRFSVLESLDPFKVGGRQINIRSVLDAASKDLQDKFQGTPMAEAEIRHTIGFAYWSLGLYKQHELHYRRAVDICRAQLGNEDPKTLLWVKELGWGYFHQSRFDEAEKLFSEAVEGMRRVLGTEDERTLHSMTSLGIVYCMQGRFDEAEELCVTAFDTCRQKLGEEHTFLVGHIHVLACLYRLQGRYNEADDLYRRGLQISLREYGERDFHTLAMKRDFGALHHKLGRYGQAEALMREALAGWQDAWGWEHQETLLAMAALGGLYRSQGRYDAAEALLAEAVEIARRVLHETHTTTGDCMHRLGAVYLSQGKYDEAELLLDEVLETARRLLGKENWATLSVKNTLAKLYEAQERYEMADSLFNETLEGRLCKLGEDHPDTLETKNDLAVLCMKQARYKEAEELLLEAIEGRRLKLGDTHPHTLESLNNLIDLYETWNKPEKAAQWRAKLPPDADLE